MEILQTYEKEWKVPPSIQDSLLDLATINYLLGQVLVLSAEHDQAIQGQLDQALIGPDESWVITTNSCQVHQPHLKDSLLSAQTRIIQVNRFLVTRWFGIYGESGLLAEWQIQFALLNLQSRKMGKIDVNQLQALHLIADQPSVRKVKTRSLLENSEEKTRLFSVQVSEIDRNDHVNNQVYLHWAAESFDPSFHTHFYPQRIQIKYGREILPDQQVHLTTFLADSPNENRASSVQVIQNQSQEEESARIDIQWLKVLP